MLALSIKYVYVIGYLCTIMWYIYRMKMVIGSEYYYTYIDESISGSTFNIPGWLGKRNGQSQIGYISTSLWKHSREAFSWFIGTNMSYKCYKKKNHFFSLSCKNLTNIWWLLKFLLRQNRAEMSFGALLVEVPATPISVQNGL